MTQATKNLRLGGRLSRANLNRAAEQENQCGSYIKQGVLRRLQSYRRQK